MFICGLAVYGGQSYLLKKKSKPKIKNKKLEEYENQTRIHVGVRET